MGALFVNVNCDKLSITLNLRNPKGVEIAKRLIAKSDVVYDNFSTGVMDKYGLGYEELVKIKPDIIMLEMPVYGLTGPYKNFSGYGPGIQASIGLTSVTGFEVVRWDRGKHSPARYGPEPHPRYGRSFSSSPL